VRITAPTLGQLSFDGVENSFTNYDARAAQRRGIRMVHQELSLCATLTVAENFFVENSQHANAKPGWRNVYRSTARAALYAVFPGNAIDVSARIDRLSIGERQMVEIARAAATPGVRLIVLDEPTSSLDLERSRQLRHYVRDRARSGLAFIFISHKLHEVMDVASRILVLRNGRVAWQGETRGASVGRLIELMGGDASVIHHRIERETRAEPEMVRAGGAFVGGGAALSLRQGRLSASRASRGTGRKPSCARSTKRYADRWAT
jgi:ribose transport system ATP-binding protein